MIRTIAIVCLLLAWILPAPPARAQPVDLRPRWETGQQHRFRMELSSATSLNLTGEKGGDDKRSIKQDIAFRLRVVEARPEADSTIELIYDSIKVSMDTGEGKGSFDSTKSGGASKPPTEGEKTLESLFKPLVGAKLTLLIDPAGNITSVTGGEAFLPGEVTANLTQKGEIANLLGGIFSPRKGTGRASVGETWENEDVIESPLIGRVRMSTRHTLKSASAREALVSIDGTIRTDSEAPEAPYSIRDGVYKGSYAWGLSEGMLRRMESTQAYKVQGDLGGLGSGGAEPVIMTNDVTLKVTRDD